MTIRPHEPAYPIYSRAERIADGTIHSIGVILAVTGAVLLMVFSAGLGGATVAGVSVYAAALIATFVASACYHMTPWEGMRPVLHRIDHAAIFLKIAGTYTPLVVLIGTGFGYVILGIVWALALVGAFARVFFWSSPARLATTLYLVMGWLSIALIWSLARTLPIGATALVVAGGVLYSLGVIFFVWESLRFSNAIWHGFVLAASACFFAAIAMGTFLA